jgi:tripeptidyl-peptidase-1
MTSQEYTSRTNTEFMKITARGVTLVGASGDQGAPGDQFASCSKGLSDIFPASSTYVLAVGATMIGTKSSEKKQNAPTPQTEAWGAKVCNRLLHPFVKCADGSETYEVVCTHPAALITSGGGFSAQLPMPAWQSAAVSAYLNSGVSLPTGLFNPQNRAFPDGMHYFNCSSVLLFFSFLFFYIVSGYGHSYLTWLGDIDEPVDGTSASTPVVASMIALLNTQRFGQNKAPLGFVAPLMYSAAVNATGVFNDVTQGNNKCTESCCSSYGYEATQGWDAATGIGSINFNKLSEYVATLQ